MSPLAPRPFSQVDVFGPPDDDSDPSPRGLAGNPLAVVHDADGLDDRTLAAFARWTNLSETTFLLPPADPRADYRVRIFTTVGELPFAGHPTLGSAHAWLEAGGRPTHHDRVVQECGAGLVEVRLEPQLAFAAPPLVRSGPVDADLAATVRAALGVGPGDVLAMEWIDNGPGWIGVDLADAEAVLALEPVAEHFTAPGPQVGAIGLALGVVGRWPDPAEVGKDVEVRAFFRDGGALVEDPVTGSLNAGIGQWLVAAGRLPTRYLAGQGARLRRDGRVSVEQEGDVLWVGGRVTTTIRGEVLLG